MPNLIDGYTSIFLKIYLKKNHTFINGDNEKLHVSMFIALINEIGHLIRRLHYINKPIINSPKFN